jgi:hypothetical protein
LAAGLLFPDGMFLLFVERGVFCVAPAGDGFAKAYGLTVRLVRDCLLSARKVFGRPQAAGRDPVSTSV